MARRFGCVVVLLSVVVVSIGVVVLWLLSTLLGGSTGDGGGLWHLARIAVIVVLVAGAAVIVLGIRLARGIGPPLGDLIEGAGRVEAGDFGTRVPEPTRGPGDVRRLVRAFNAMATRLESDEAQRRRLLSDVSHELRTPLAVVQGNIEALIDGIYPPDEAHLAPILEETRVMSRLIEDLRTLSSAEAGQLVLHREPSDLAVLIGEVVASFGPTARTAGVAVVAETADDLPIADIDPIRVREVLANLVSNALRYAPSGTSVLVRASPPSAAGGAGHVAITVSDQGPGIAPALLATVFDRFAKTAESRGSGLGLAIAKAIVEAHGGTIEAASAPDQGTTITVTLPID
jgi:signal transduction histidine kinase